MEKSSEKSEIKVHPLFPTFQEVAQSPDLFLTDHLAIFAAMPLDDDPRNDIKLLSINITGAGAENNIVRTVEDAVGATLRYQRVAKGAKLSADKLHVDVIVFQEVTPDLFLSALKTTFDDNWIILPGEEEIAKQKPQQFTLFRKSRLELIALKEWDARKKTLTSTFKVLSNGLTLVVHNVWTEYDPLPFNTENYYRTLLSDAPPGTRIVIIGDTNSRLAPVLNDFPKNLTTGIVPPMFNSNYGVGPDDKVPDNPDGGFYLNPQGKTRQLIPHTVDLATGSIVTDTRKISDVLGDHPGAAVVAVWNQPRAVLCLDSAYAKEKLIQGKTIFEYEQQLQQIFADPKIFVRITSTIFNKKGIIVRFKNLKAKSDEVSMADLLMEMLKDNNAKVEKLLSGVVSYPCLFIELSKAGIFAEAVDMLSQVIAGGLLTELTTEGMLPLARQFLSATFPSSVPDVEQKAIDSLSKAKRDYTEPFESKGGDSSSFGDTLFGLAASIGTLGQFYRNRESVINARMAEASAGTQSKIEVVLNLLDSAAGHDLASFNYYLSSYFILFKAESDRQAELLTKLVRTVLASKINYGPQIEEMPQTDEGDNQAPPPPGASQ